MLDYKHTTKFTDNNTPESRPTTEGLRRLSRSNPKALSCGACGSQQRKLGAGGASLLCQSCGEFIRWIGAGEVKAIATQVQGEVL